MFCQRVILLNGKLCTKSDVRARFVQREVV